MPPTIKVNTKRPKVLFNKKTTSSNDLMRSHRTCITTSTTTATTATTAANIRTSHQTTSSLRLGTQRKSGAAADGQSATPRNRDTIMDPAGIGKTSDVMIDSDTMLGVGQKGSCIPEMFTSLPPLKDRLQTKTSRVQDRTVQDCLPLLAAIHDPSRNLFDFNAHGLPRLEREKHVEYLHNCLRELPAGFVVHDASRPWILYWVLAGLCLLGEDVQHYRTRFIALKRVQTGSSWVGGANGCVLQSGADVISNAESGWWLWRGSRPNVTLCAILCSNPVPCDGWWKGKLGHD